MLVHEDTAFRYQDSTERGRAESAREARFAAQSLPALEASGFPVAPLVREYIGIFLDKVPAVLPSDRGIQHEIDLLPGEKYGVTRQWPHHRDQVVVIEASFESRLQAGHVRESLQPHSRPTFCVTKATGGWRIVHAFNKLNDASIPAQTPIPRKDMVLDTMYGSTKYSAIDLVDGFYLIGMREEDVPLTAASTPSRMLWGLITPGHFQQSGFTSSDINDIFIHSLAEDGMTNVEVQLDHIRQVFELMRENKLYAKLKKGILCTPEIPVLGSYVSKEGVRADPEKIEAICACPPPNDQKQLRRWIGLAAYLHHYSKNFAATL
ncbi:polyprotein [Phytophthora megakarya]|uniref:Polyprotein n=1 Tax=Phytophthora megakarya TaxID=4795 RepID=A0A225VV31_9STRA|nr:polyprotein [Phytophthora megakarya]